MLIDNDCHKFLFVYFCLQSDVRHTSLLCNIPATKVIIRRWLLLSCNLSLYNVIIGKPRSLTTAWCTFSNELVPIVFVDLKGYHYCQALDMALDLNFILKKKRGRVLSESCFWDVVLLHYSVCNVDVAILEQNLALSMPGVLELVVMYSVSISLEA